MNWRWPLRWAADRFFGEDEAPNAVQDNTPIEVPVERPTDAQPRTNSTEYHDRPDTTSPNTDPVLTRDERLDTAIDLEIGGHIVIDGWESSPVHKNTTTDTDNVDRYPPTANK